MRIDSKKIRKRLNRFIGYFGLVLCTAALKFFPEAWLCGFANQIANIAYSLVRKQRNIAIESLAIAFGKEKTEQEINKIAKDCFVFMAKSAVELIFLMDRPHLIRRKVRLVGKEYLEGALAKGRGVILVSAHFGNFPLMLARLSIEGYKTAGIMRFMRDEQVEKILMRKRTRLGVKTIYSQPRKECVEKSIRSLRNNEVLFIPLDQNFGSGGVFVNFFGRKAATATGPVVLARRTQAAIMPCFIVRQKDDTHKIIFEPALNLEKGKDDQETVAINIQRLTDIIELYIRRYPAEWGWIHRRWKSQPN